MTLPEDRALGDRLLGEPKKRTLSPGARKLKRALAADRKRKAQPSEPDWRTVSQPRLRITYVHLDGRVWDGHAWHRRDEKWWNSRVRREATDRVLEVGDVGGATTIEVGSNIVIRRGCLIDGDLVVHDQVAVGKWADGPWRGGLCLACHKWWTEASISQKRSFDGLARHVTDRLIQEGFLDGAKLERTVQVTADFSRIERFDLRDWAGKTWAFRVLAADRPEIQQPPRKPFGYLSGPIRVKDIEEASA
jgi:hypothetical protein